MFGKRHVDVGQVIDDLAVELFRNALVEASIARFEMENRYLATLGCNDGEAGIGIAIQEDRVRALLLEQIVHLADHVADRLCSGVSRGFQKEIRLRHTKVIEEHLVQFVIVILAGMHQLVLHELGKFRDDAAELDDFRPGADDGHDFHWITPDSASWLSRWLRAASLRYNRFVRR